VANHLWISSEVGPAPIQGYPRLAPSGYH
jgi:hypothetical protein